VSDDVIRATLKTKPIAEMTVDRAIQDHARPRRKFTPSHQHKTPFLQYMRYTKTQKKSAR
jgi:hypothetical protein